MQQTYVHNLTIIHERQMSLKIAAYTSKFTNL